MTPHPRRSIVTLLVLACSLWVQAGVAQTAPSDLQLFLLMGQSNMAGRGEITAQDQVTHPRIWMLTQDNRWVPAKDPVHYDRDIAGVGLSSQFARDLANADPQANIGLIPTAVGGSSINEWAPGTLHYNTAVARARAALANGRLAGILWHQGEADSTATGASTYLQKFASLIGQLRADLNAASVPVIAGELGRFRSTHSALNPTLALIPQRVPLAGFATAEGLAHKGDTLHFNTPALYEFGHRYILQWGAVAAWKNFEAENLTSTRSGGSSGIINDVPSSAGRFIEFQPTATGQYIQFTLPSIAAGTYTVKIRFQRSTTRGRCTVAVDGTPLGAEIDQAGSSTHSAEVVLGDVSFATLGNHVLRVTASSSPTSTTTLSVDSVILIQRSSVPPPEPPATQILQGESLPNTRTGGSTGILNDAGASGGRWLKYYPSAIGQSIVFTTPAISAGTYTVKIRHKLDPDRGRCTVQLDGAAIGAEIEQYAAVASYMETTLGTITWTTNATHTFRVTSSGTSRGSRSLSIDAFILEAESAPPPPPPPPPADPIVSEAENASRTLTGGKAGRLSDAQASAGNWLKFYPSAFGQSITFQLPSVPAGTYEIKYRCKKDPDRGRCTVRVDGGAASNEIDQYSPTMEYAELSLGTFTFSTAGSHSVQVTASSSSRSSKNLSMDAFILVPQ